MKKELPMQLLGPCPKELNPNLLKESDSVKFSMSNCSRFAKQSSFLGEIWIITPLGIVKFESGIL